MSHATASGDAFLRKARDAYKESLAELEAEIERLRARIAGIDAILADRNGIDAIAAGGDEVVSAVEPSPAAPRPYYRWRGLLTGLTQMEALIRIAEENDGILKIVEAKHIFANTGMTKSNLRNIPSHIHKMLSDSDRFERVGPGAFRLLPEPRRSVVYRDAFSTSLALPLTAEVNDE